MAIPFPFSAIVGQDEMKLAIQIVAIDPKVGGILALGDRGTGKSTAVRALADLLPPLQVVVGCSYGCDPASSAATCTDCASLKATGKRPKTATRPVPVVDLPLGASEDRVVGALDLEKALSQGIKAFSPGLLAQANRGFFIYRRSQFVGRPFGRFAHRCRRLWRECGRARRPVGAPPRALCVGRQRQPRRRRIAPPIA